MEHSQRLKVFDFCLREENRVVWITLVAQQRTNAQLNSHMAPTGNRTGVTLVRGERFTHKPTNQATQEAIEQTLQIDGVISKRRS